jgi:hypothetical protein
MGRQAIARASGSQGRHRTRASWLPQLALAAVMLAGGAAQAQQGTGSLTGTTLDNNTKKPLPDVIVTVTGPALQEGQIVVSDSSGFYRIPNLPPGVYTMNFEKEGYFPNSQDGISVRADVTLRLNAALALAQGQAEEVVIKVRPTVDVGSSSSGASLNSELLRRVPVSAPGGKGAASRSFESAAELAPGTGSDSVGTTVNGSSSPENHYSVDGLSVGNPGKGTVGTQLTTEFVEEVNVVTAGYMPEFGRSTGGVLNVVTKSGSNQFHGGVFSYLSPGSLQGAQKVPHQDLNPVTYSNKMQPILGIWDVGGDLGGPIIKDKLWFYVGFDMASTNYNVDRSFYRTKLDSMGNLGDIDPNALYTQRYLADQKTFNMMAKLTWSLNADNRFTLSAYGTPTTSGGGASFNGKEVTPGKYAINPLSAAPESGGAGTYSSQAHQYISTPLDVAAKWNSEFLNKKLLLDVMLGTHYQKDSARAADGSGAADNGGLAGYYAVNYARNPTDAMAAGVMGDAARYHSITEFESLPKSVIDKCNATGYTCDVSTYAGGAPLSLNEAIYNRYHGSVILSYLTQGLGHHIFKAGFDTELTTYQNRKIDRVYQETTDGQQFNDLERFGILTGPDQFDPIDILVKKTSSLLVGGFLQDSWSVLDKVTLNLGIRYDAQYFYGTDGTMAMSLPNQWSPRLGVIFDPTQTGKAKVYFNYARYYENAPLDFADVALVGEPQAKGGHVCDATVFANQISKGPNGCQNPDKIVPNTTDSPQLPNKNYNATGFPNTLDPGVKASSSDEISAGGEYEVLPDARAGLSYTRRWLDRWVEDMGPFVGQPGYAGNPGFGLGTMFPKASRNYDAVTLFLVKNFSQSWLAQASYTASWLRGNYSGLVAPEDGYLGPNATADFDGPNIENNRTGPLPGDFRHNIKLLGSKDWAISPTQHLGTGISLRARSGGPTSYLGADRYTYADEAYLTPRGSGVRLPWVYNADLQFSYRVAAYKGIGISATADVFNVLNLQKVVGVSQSYTDDLVVANQSFNKTGDLDKVKAGASYPYPGLTKGSDAQPIVKKASFGDPVAYQAPRVFRFGLRGEF